MKPDDAASDRCEGSNVKIRVCLDWLLGGCGRDPCRYSHEAVLPSERRAVLQFCHDYQNKGCMRVNCRFVHCTTEQHAAFMRDGVFPPFTRIPRRPQISVPPFNWPPPPPPAPSYYVQPEIEGPPQAKFMRIATELDLAETNCANCIAAEQNVKRVHENYNVLLKKYNELKQKNVQLTSMNEFLLEQTSVRDRETTMAMTSRASSTMNLATVSMTPVVSLSELVPPGTPSLALDPTTSRAQILTQAPQLITHNAGTLIVTSTGAHQLMQASAPATLVGGGQAVVAVAPAQLVASPSPATVQQLVQHSAQLAAAQSAQQLVAQQSQLTQQSLSHMSGTAAQALVHPSSAQMTLSSAPQAMTQASTHFKMISQSILPH